MHLAKFMTGLTVCILWCGSPFGICTNSSNAQPPNTVEADRPTQRWLPLPLGDGADLSEQALLLQQLRDLISSESQNGTGNTPLPKLSEEQLREMEKALESMRDLIGEDKLPNLESIPKEWIDQALSDPVLRKQAQQLLEQYARDRKLPQASDNAPRNSNGVPFPRRQPSDKSIPKSNPRSNPNPNLNSRPNSSSQSPTPDSDGPNSQRPNSQTSPDLFPPVEDPFSNSSDSNSAAQPTANSTNELKGNERIGTAQGSDDQTVQPKAVQPNGTRGNSLNSGKGESSSAMSPDRTLPSGPDAERIEALRELFKKLKTIEGQRSPTQSTPKRNPASTNSNLPNQPGSNSSNNIRSTKPNPPRGQSNPALPSRARSGNPTPPPAQDSPNRSVPSNSIDSGNGLSGNPNSDPPLMPPDLENPIATNSGSGRGVQSNSRFSESSKRPQGSTPSGSNSLGNSLGNTLSNSLGSNSQNAGPSGSRTNPADRTRNGLPGAFGDKNSPTGSGSLVQDADIKTQLERHGLGRALQSIVEKTMKEQGESNAAKQSTGKSPSAQPKSKDNLANNKSQTTPSTSTPSPAANKPPSKKADPIAKNSGVTANPSLPSSNQNANTPSMMSGWRDTASQFWGAIRSTPSERGGGSTASSPGSLGSFGDYEFVWNGHAWLVLGLVLVFCVLLLFLARKRVVLASAAKEAEAELAKEILNQGIRTRADVIRAFHRFVLRRAQPVANWWNHRYVAARLSDASPQLSAVISDLANVYEHARYLPPEVKLSSEEIDRVQSALKQCAASGV